MKAPINCKYIYGLTGDSPFCTLNIYINMNIIFKIKIVEIYEFNGNYIICLQVKHRTLDGIQKALDKVFPK